jgi:hypothetical protein
MKTLKNLDIQVKAFIITAIVLAVTFTVMLSLHGFRTF